MGNFFLGAANGWADGSRRGTILAHTYSTPVCFMNTFSHLIVNGALAEPIQKRVNASRWPTFRTGAFLFGSIAPDLLLTVTAILLGAYDLLFGVGLPRFDGPGDPFIGESLLGKLFTDWFFNNPWIIAEQNLLHSPLLITIYLALGFWLWRRGWNSSWFFWFAAGCFLHTLADIPLHYDDGPLLLFPLNWEWRFMSPVSYWDPARYGREWSLFEYSMDAVLLLYFAVRYRDAIAAWVGRRRQ